MRRLRPVCWTEKSLTGRWRICWQPVRQRIRTTASICGPFSASSIPNPASCVFRIDAPGGAGLFSDGPQAEADDYIAVETNLLDIPAGSGLLVNDNLGIPDADLVGFGGGDLGGTPPADNAPPVQPSWSVADGSLTVNADGSFSFEAESGFEGGLRIFSIASKILPASPMGWSPSKFSRCRSPRTNAL